MPTTDPVLIRAFWSYARDDERNGTELCLAMRAKLSITMTARYTVDLVRDNDSHSGFKLGRDWRGELARKIASSVLFFWVQSPRWIGRPMCRLEYAMFHAQVERIAARLSTKSHAIDPDKLWDNLVVPIRWETVHEDQWQEYDPEVAARFRPIWRARQAREELDFVGVRTDPADLAARCHAVIGAIRNKLYEAIPDGLPALLRFVAVEDRAFIAEWRERFEDDKPGPAAPAAGRNGLADRGNGRRHDPNFGLSYFLATDPETGATFWTTVAPLEKPLAAHVREALPTERQPVGLPDGHLGWDAAAAAAIADMLEPRGVWLPDTHQAAGLRRIFALGKEAREQMGWRSPVGNFWCRDEQGSTVPAAGAANHLPVVLIQERS